MNIYPALYDRFMLHLERRILLKLRTELFAKIPNGSRLLEIGAGTGVNFQFHNVAKLSVATDLSFEMLSKATDKTEFTTLVQADAHKLPFSENAFDVAIATLVFCSIKNPIDALNELARVLTPNSPILLIEHVRPSGLLGFLFDVVNRPLVVIFSENICMNTETLIRYSQIRIENVSIYAKGILKVFECRTAS
ncbi:MAG: class I SAM-dependent methyltransferase [Pyrinomonadaceae bacterium]